jgi:hypothetical protein
MDHTATEQKVPCSLPLEIKPVNVDARQSWRRCLQRPLLPYWQSVRDALLNRHVPIGYEDETGFHYGAEGGGSEG